MKRFLLMLMMSCSLCYGDLELLLSSKKIEEKIASVAKQIDLDYRNKELVLVVVMKGGICLASDLMRQLSIPFTLEYMRASSYGKNGTTRGNLVLKGMEEIDFSDKDLLIIDDIFDSGKTMTAIVEEIKKYQPKSVKSLVLLNKKIVKKTSYQPDYVLFEIEDKFVVGYGMDYKEYYRGLPGIYGFINNIPCEKEDKQISY